MSLGYIFEGNYLQRLNIMSLSSTSIFFSVQLFEAEQLREVLGFSGIAIDTIKLFALQCTAWFQSLQPSNFLFLASVVTVLTMFLFFKWESFSQLPEYLVKVQVCARKRTVKLFYRARTSVVTFLVAATSGMTLPPSRQQTMVLMASRNCLLCKAYTNGLMLELRSTSISETR